MKDKHLPPEAAARIAAVLAQMDWDKNYPKFADRLTAYREAKERITARVLSDLATEQAREAADKERAARAEQARYGQGGRYGR